MTTPAPLHQGPIRACAFVGADQLATGSLEGRVRLWDWKAGGSTGAIDAHAGPVHSLVWDARRGGLVSAGHDGRIVIHGLDGARQAVLEGHKGGVHALAVSPDGARLASGGYDRTIRIWRLADGTEILRLEGHEAAVTSLDFLDNGRLVSGGRDDTVRFWDLEAGRESATGRGHLRWVTEVRALAAGDAISVSEDGTFRCWRSENGEERWRFALPEDRPIWGLARSDDLGRAILGVAGYALGCDLSQDGVVRTKTLTPATTRAIAVRGDLFALGADTDGVLMFDGWRYLSTLETHAIGALSLAARRDPGSGVIQAVVGQADGRVEFNSGRVRREAGGRHDAFTYAAERVGPDLFATGGFDGMVRLWRASDGALIRTLAHAGFVFSLSASRDGTRLLVAGAARVSLWDVASGDAIWRAETPRHGFHNFAALRADGAEVVVVGEAATLGRWTLPPDGTGAGPSNASK